ncbi:MULTISPECIES: RidA family protein [unclassified Veillonella]|jgi:putative endoribonuclease L-PSP|uniref:RidA family protein n=1 Tax=unclassified Veillonella TaxID=2630086 RepID=UPI00021A1AB1|nr:MULTISPECIES: RidA family protein [unclassified Veillonella]EGS37175.1 putative endoribonuclease L-PSP [Veillonella sp. oral taxon 780 str. F0422]KXB88575.1 putative endoribonuclease L-PSP [Veillonella sp. DNF00869]MBS6627009.1 RidA family protein [Veillonella sp. oral taxon 780]RKW67447.1 MAG: RidA family protein [Veillonella sp.]
MKQVYTEQAPAALGPYSQAYKANGFVFISGQGGIDPAQGALVEGGVEAQTLQAMKNIEAILKEAGTDFSKVVKTTCFLADMGDFAKFNAIYAEYFTSKPARSCVAVKTLPANFLVEVEVIALAE